MNSDYPYPEAPGLYLAQPVSEIPQGVITQDPRHAATCARVNCSNVKFGKAERSLAARYRTGYLRDFGQNIRFEPIALVSAARVREAEKLVKRQLKDFRMRSPKGRPLEWLSGIEATRVRALVLKTLTDAGIPHEVAGMNQSNDGA